MERTIRSAGYTILLATSFVLLRASWRAEPVGGSDLATAIWALLPALGGVALIDWWKTLPPAWQTPGGDGEPSGD